MPLKPRIVLPPSSYIQEKHKIDVRWPAAVKFIREHGLNGLNMQDVLARTIGVERIHIEQDAGKLMHDQHPTRSYVDLNRSGVALMEIVSKPDIRSAEEARAYVTKLRTILRYLGTCDGNMEEGSMRADVNISVRKPGAPLGTRAEIKNVNSFKFVKQAIEYEIQRQIDLIEDGGALDKLMSRPSMQQAAMRAINIAKEEEIGRAHV